jgi:hypothetical protein
MAPLLVSALVSIGMKIATDLFMAGAKEVVKPGGPAASFAATLDKARSASAGGSAGAAGEAKPAALDAGFGDRSRVMVADLSGSVPAAARAHGVGAYQRMELVQAP